MRDPRESEVEQSHRDSIAFGEQDVRRLDVAVHDAFGMCMREALEDLRSSFDRIVVGQLAGAQGLAERSARNVFEGDVDVVVVATARVCPQAAGVCELCERLRLSARAGARFPLAGHDLHGDLAPAAVVPREPDRPRAAAPEWADGAVSAEEESLFEGCCGRF